MPGKTTTPSRKAKVQYNIRVDPDVLRGFREYCARNGLDPQGQVVLFMKRVIESEFDFQERLWAALQEESS
ncbi:MAG TPA: hypothetical protein HA326_04975 [Thermoplasmata archaeon]|nr:hypothetical protein [Thermoplasmata archaeon]